MGGGDTGRKTGAGGGVAAIAGEGGGKGGDDDGSSARPRSVAAESRGAIAAETGEIRGDEDEARGRTTGAAGGDGGGTEVEVEIGAKRGGDDEDESELGAEIFAPTAGTGSGRHAVTLRTWCSPCASEHAIPHPHVASDSAYFFERRRAACREVEGPEAVAAPLANSRCQRAHSACRYDSGWKRRSLTVWARRQRSPSGHWAGDCHTPSTHARSHGRDS